MARTKRQLSFGSKVINEIEFTCHEYHGGKYEITACGYEGVRLVGYDTWEKQVSGNKTDKRSSFHPENKRWFQASFTKIVEVIEKHIKKSVVDLNSFRDYVTELFERALEDPVDEERAYKKCYRDLAKKYHPDTCTLPNANELFKIIKECYDSNGFM